jgi:hypothetical protein
MCYTDIDCVMIHYVDFKRGIRGIASLGSLGVLLRGGAQQSPEVGPRGPKKGRNTPIPILKSM